MTVVSLANVQCVAPSVAADDRAPSFEQDDVAPATVCVLAHPLLDADPPEADPLVERQAGGVLGDDAREQGPVAGRLRGRDERLEQRPADAAAARVGRDVDALPGDAGVDLARRVAAERRPAERRARPRRGRRTGSRSGATGRSEPSRAPRARGWRRRSRCPRRRCAGRRASRRRSSGDGRESPWPVDGMRVAIAQNDLGRGRTGASPATGTTVSASRSTGRRSPT